MKAYTNSQNHNYEEVDIVIVGAGIAGLTTALALHRLGLRSLVLESSERLRVTGFALTLWTNAWKALDIVGIGDTLRQKIHPNSRNEDGLSRYCSFYFRAAT